MGHVVVVQRRHQVLGNGSTNIIADEAGAEIGGVNKTRRTCRPIAKIQNRKMGICRKGAEL